ncbi:MAG: GNAT family N-acetyltransferase [Actinomycetota bacterium]|nr:GNAT family N-acetyltransferase [Actinomycetota bacterium]
MRTGELLASAGRRKGDRHFSPQSTSGSAHYVALSGQRPAPLRPATHRSVAGRDDRTNFERRWARLRSDGSTTNRVVEIGGRVVGHIASFDLEGHREVTYWIGREDWGRGIATRALQEFLQLEATRPLYAQAASDNAASIRVLTKCGFLIVGEGRGFAHGRGEETDEVVLRLDA